MKKTTLVVLSMFLMVGCQQPGFFFNPPGGGNNSQVATHVLDGINDFSEEEVVGIDGVGDISEQSLDLDTLWASKDDSMLYIGFNAHSSSGYGMSYGIYIFTDSIASSGASGDPWNRLVNYENFYPEYVVYFWHDASVDSITSAQFITFTGSWNYNDIGRDVFVYNSTLDFMEVFIPLEWIGNPDSIFIEVFTTGGENSHAQDTSPEDNNVQFADPDWNQVTTSLSSAAPVK